MTKRFLQSLSWIALAGTISPSVLFLTGHLTLDSVKTWTLLATLAWFVTTPLWMGHESRRSGQSQRDTTAHRNQ